MTRSKSPAPTLTACSISAVMAALIGAVVAAPDLRMENADGSEISRKPCAIGWGDGYGSDGNRLYFVHTIENELANLSGVVSGTYLLATLYDDGKARTWQAARSSDSLGIPSLSWVAAENVKSLALANSHSLALKHDGSLQVLQMGISGPPPSGLGAVSAIAAGRDHLMALRIDGTVAAWSHVNANTYGQATVPAGLGGVVSIGAGDIHSVALKSDGTVVAWGATPQRQVPAGLNQVTQIAVGPKGTIALKTDGSLVSWGSSELTPPGDLGAIRQVAAGERYGAGVKTDGAVAVWGWTQNGFLLPPPGLGEVTAVAAGENQLVAITPRRIIPFGNVGRSLQLQKSFTIRNSGDQALNLGGITLTGIQGSGFTLDSAGTATLLAPGQSTAFNIRFAPTALGSSAALLTVASNDPADPQFRFSVSANGINLPPVANDLAVALPEDSPGIEIEMQGSDPNGDPLQYLVTTYNYSDYGQLVMLGGNKIRFTPAPDFAGTFSFTYDVYDGDPYTFGSLKDTGTVSVTVTQVNDDPFLTLPPGPVVRASSPGAGATVSFNVGAGDLEDGRLSPVMLVNGQEVHSGDVFPPGTSVVEVQATDANGVVVTGSFEIHVMEGPCLAVQDAAGKPVPRSGQVVAWGSNAAGQSTVPADLVDITAISGGTDHSVALREDGTVVAWGGNTYGQASVPADLSGVVAISGGGHFNLALKQDGTVRAWGLNSTGQTSVPAGLSGVTAIAAGAGHSLALRQNGSVVGWGSNFADAIAIPSDLPPATAIAAGYYESFARAANGAVILWGVGGGATRDVDFPSWLSGVEAIASGLDHSVALRSDGSVVAWGVNDAGESTVPSGLGDAVSVGVGYYFSVAARRDGTVVKWGSPPGGLTPPAGLSGVGMVACGKDHILALKDRKERAAFRMPVAFGPVHRVLKVANTGTSELEIDGLSLVGGQAGDFTMDASGIPGSLQPGQSADLPVTFLPTALGLRQTTLRLITNDPAATTRDIALAGIWQNASPVSSPVSGLSLAEDSVEGIEITLPAADANGQPIIFEIVTPPPAAAGALGPLVGNKVRFTPAPDFHGAVSFTFRASDPFSAGNTAAVNLSVTPVPDAPRLILPASPWFTGIFSGTGSPVEFIAGASDAEDGWLNASITRGGVPVASGANFPIGDTLVEVTATDSAGMTTTGSFIVRVALGPDLVIEHANLPLPRTREIAGWGRNLDLQLNEPAGLAGATALAAGEYHSLALKPDGTVAAWGRNSSGQTNVPAGLSGVVGIGAGALHSLAVKGDGTVVAWGSNGSGQTSVPATLPAVAAVAGGESHSLAACQNGTVVAWGSNSQGQRTVPAGLANITGVAAGSAHSVALRQNGTVVAWGSNLYGQTTVPAGLAGVKSVKAGSLHTVALRHDGTVVAWGYNANGQTTVPPGLKNVKEIAAGNNHTVALTSDGTVVAWGFNTGGQVLVPADLGRTKAIAAGSEHTLALSWTTPDVNFGTVSQGSTAATALTLRNDGPGTLEVEDLVLTSGNTGDFSVQAAGLHPDLESGGSSSFGIIFSPASNGPKRAILTVRSNDSSNPAMKVALTGHGRNGSPVATAVTGTTVVEDTAAGVTITLPASDPEGDPLTYLIASPPAAGTGTLGPVVGNQVTFFPALNYHGPASFTFKANDAGTDSQPAAVAITVTPVNDAPVISYLPAILRVTTPLTGGTPVSFRLPKVADPEDGPIIPALTLANGTPVTSGSVFPIGTSTVTIHATDSGGLAVSGSFVVNVSLVSGAEIQLEAPGGAGLPRPPAVVDWTRSGISGEIPPELRGVTELAAGADHGLARRTDGTVVGWGDNSQGQLSVPAGLLTATKIRSGSHFAMALRSNGTVVAWGSNSSNQTTVPGTATSVTDIAAGGSHALARQSDGTVIAWGNNASGQTTVPTGLTGVTAVAAGENHSLALKSDGTVVGWGSNSHGQRSIPAGLSGVVALAAGGFHSLALKTDGTVVAWGRSAQFQTPAPAGLSGVTAIAAGGYHSLVRTSDGSALAWGSYEPGARITTLPPEVTAVSAIAGAASHLMASVPSRPVFGMGTTPAGIPVTKVVTIRNGGGETLTLTSITPVAGSADYTLQLSGMAASVPPGQTTSFGVTFSPAVPGQKVARFRIASNDRYSPSMDFDVSGEGIAPFYAWAATVGLGVSGVNPEAIPHGDGVASLLKYAFNMNGAAADSRRMTPGTGTAGLPSVTLEAGMLTIEFVRRKSGDLIYTATRSPSLAGSSFTPITAQPVVTDIDATWERVVIREAVDLALTPKLFGRVEVKMK